MGLVTSVAARETILATLGTLYGIDPESHAMDLQSALRHEISPAAAIALLVFYRLRHAVCLDHGRRPPRDQ